MATSAEKLVKQTIKLLSKTQDLDYEELKVDAKKIIKAARNFDETLLGMMEEMMDLGNIGTPEELEEFNEQIPELSSVGLFAVKKVLELYKTDISNRTLFKVFKNVNSSMRKASDLHILITAYISNIMNESMTSANIEAFINHINTKSPEEKATIIKLIHIYIDRTIFTLDKLRASFKLQEGGRGKTSRKNRKY